MTFDEYQAEAEKTAIYPLAHYATYPALGLCGEAGEVAEKIKKVLRDHGGDYSTAGINEIGKELGDVLWYVAAICRDLGLSMGEVAQGNLAKLADRAERGKLQGSGDSR